MAEFQVTEILDDSSEDSLESSIARRHKQKDKVQVDFIKRFTKEEGALNESEELEPWQNPQKWGKKVAKGEKKRIETKVLEFDWIFRGDNAKNFFEHLAFTDQETLFSIETIRIVVLFMW